MRTRRDWIVGSGAVLLWTGCRAAAGGARKGEPGKEGDEEVTPGEDLMREHGVLRRVLLVYGEAVRRIEARLAFPVDALGSAAGLVKRFVEDYHEKTEEEMVFPRFEKAGKSIELVKILREQHARGRARTEIVLRATSKGPAMTDGDRGEVATALKEFVRMYEPHAAREDTDLFPSLRAIVGADEYAELGDEFEDREHEQLGDRGFESAVLEVAQLEKAFAIGDLAAFS